MLGIDVSGGGVKGAAWGVSGWKWAAGPTRFLCGKVGDRACQ